MEDYSLKDMIAWMLGINVVAVSIIMFIFKISIAHSLNRSLVRIKGEVDENILLRIEPLKALYSKENITYQITRTEIIKYRISSLNKLYSDIYDLYKYLNNLVLNKKDSSEDEYFKSLMLIEECKHSLNYSTIFIDNDFKISVLKSLQPFVEMASAYIGAKMDWDAFRVTEHADVGTQEAYRKSWKNSLMEFQQKKEQLHNALGIVAEQINKYISEPFSKAKR